MLNLQPTYDHISRAGFPSDLLSGQSHQSKITVRLDGLVIALLAVKSDHLFVLAVVHPLSAEGARFQGCGGRQALALLGITCGIVSEVVPVADCLAIQTLPEHLGFSSLSYGAIAHTHFILFCTLLLILHYMGLIQYIFV